MSVTSFWFLDIFILLSTVTFLLHKYISRNYDYWQKRKIHYIEPKPFVGNFLDIFLFRTTIGEYLANLYNSTKDPFFGIFVFDIPHLIIRSPELVKSIMVRDFNYFDNRTTALGDHDVLINSMLFLSKNPEWKAVRTKMTPFFTTGKLKGMLPLINQVGEELRSYLAKNVFDFSVDAKDVCGRYSTDVIARCAFAIHAHSFDSDDADFRRIGKLAFDFRWKTAIHQTSYFFFPGLVRLFKLRFFDYECSKFIEEIFWNSMEHRKNDNGPKQHDLIDTIIDLQKNKDFCDSAGFYGDKVVAQAAQFFFAGYETTSSTIAFTLYELALQPHIQTKLRAEIISCSKEHGGFTYEAIKSMKYLQMCVSETLRKYPALPFLDRRCNADYKIPGSDMLIEKGTPVYIPMFGLHYDEEYFPNPAKYNPERFSEKNMDRIVPFSYLPFGEGPRNCIGARLGALSAKLGLIHILSEFEVEKTPKTPTRIEFQPKSFVLASKVGVPLKFRKIHSTAA